jgi:hypothetical protein
LTGGEVFSGVNGNSRTPFTTNWTNFGPRASIAWQANQKVVVRVGSGIYYGPSTHMVANSFFNSDGFDSNTTWDASTYNADGNTVPLNLLNNPFPNGIVQPLGSSQGLATYLGSQLTTEMHSQPTPVTYNFNLGVENELGHGVLFALAYVGSRGRQLPLTNVDLNQLSLETIGQYQGALNNPVPNPYANIFPSTNAFAGSPTIPQALTLEPFPQFNCGAINCGVTTNAWALTKSNYNSLQTKVQKRLTAHFTTLAAYTWSKLLTDDYNGPLAFVGFQGTISNGQDWRDLKNEYSYAPQDIKNQFNWQTSYDLPVGRGRALNLNGWQNQAFGGWTANTIVYLSTGVPIGPPNGTLDPYFNQRVDQVCDPASGAQHAPTQWFNYTCFAQPASFFVAGTAPRAMGDVRTNGAHDLDMSLYKTFTLGAERNVKIEG